VNNSNAGVNHSISKVNSFVIQLEELRKAKKLVISVVIIVLSIYIYVTTYISTYYFLLWWEFLALIKDKKVTFVY